MNQPLFSPLRSPQRCPQAPHPKRKFLAVKLDWSLTNSEDYVVNWSTNLEHWTSISVGDTSTWTDPTNIGTKRFYRISD